MDRLPLLEDPVEDGKKAKKTAPRVITFEWVCDMMRINSLIYLSDCWFQFNKFDIERMAPSQAADLRALVRAMLWFRVAAAVAAVLALHRRPAGGRRGVRLALALVALACTAVTHYNKVLIFLLDARSHGNAGKLFFLCCWYFLVAFFAVLDLLAFVFLLRWFATEEDK